MISDEYIESVLCCVTTRCKVQSGYTGFHFAWSIVVRIPELCTIIVPVLLPRTSSLFGKSFVQACLVVYFAPQEVLQVPYLSLPNDSFYTGLPVLC